MSEVFLLAVDSGYDYNSYRHGLHNLDSRNDNHLFHRQLHSSLYKMDNSKRLVRRLAIYPTYRYISNNAALYMMEQADSFY